MLAIVALGETIVVASGGIDLSVGVSVDMASMIFVMLMAAGYGGVIGVAVGLGAALCVGLLNAVLVTRLKISPFLATLGVLFIGRSVQQLATGGGLPIYLITGPAAETFKTITRTSFLGVPTPVWVFVVCAIVVYLVLHHSVFGRYVQALGAQPGVAWYSGVRVSRQLSFVYVAGAFLCGIAGILLSATVRSYVPMSGNAFQLDAIGATFIGTTLTPGRRPSVIGTILEVMLLAIVRNGLLLVGWNFSGSRLASACWCSWCWLSASACVAAAIRAVCREEISSVTTFDVSSLGFYVLDILGRPVSEIPPGGHAAMIDEIALTVAGTGGGTAAACGILGLKFAPLRRLARTISAIS